ncbi:MAG: DUF72 domain-containing protein [Candidatus Aminicenantes bacterium]|nr:DUF72 domain-containing protein [Candidatus Aminicenantes bacterium]MDH5706326.1 DUF72 domain-containing protein [Candidatus Aminicenantes bacterium]
MIYFLGTSGWSYPDWRGRFYPEDLSQRKWLPFYAEHFKTVEINMTFYRFPKPETLKGWLDKTPSNFTFTLKANRQITHYKKLQDVKGDLRYFYLLADSLQERLGCILFQLPPSLTKNMDLLQDFLSHLSPNHKNVIEFRHESWFSEEVYSLLRSHKVTFCVISSPELPDHIAETAEISYFRFHGRIGWYKYNYADEELKEWAEAIKKTKSKECFIYFNNDYNAYAVANCKKLGEFLQAS